MIAESRPFLPESAIADRPSRASTRRHAPITADVLQWRSIAARYGPVMAALFGFCAFLPYPAVAVGEHTAIQAGNVLVLILAAPALMAGRSKLPFFLFPLLLAPTAFSTFKVALTGTGDLEICFKSISTIALSLLTLLPAQMVAPRHGVWMMTGIAAAILLHAAVGAWQMVEFSHGQLPLLDLYQNPSFLSVKDEAETIANYIRRPFGLFPEPSAMSASIAPWVVFWMAEATGLVRLRARPAAWQRMLFLMATVSGTALMIVSQSGHAAITLAALVVCAIAWLLRSRATGKTFLTLVGVFCAILPLAIWLESASLNQRAGKSSLEEGSWHDRASSLWAGFEKVMESGPTTWVFGLGPGQTSPLLVKGEHIPAVWSVSLPYVYQNGLIGLAVVSAVGYFFLRVWRSTGFSIAYALMLLVWVVGLTVTTSYVQLLPLWIAMGWLSVWPLICAPRKPVSLHFRYRLPSRLSESNVPLNHDSTVEGRVDR